MIPSAQWVRRSAVVASHSMSTRIWLETLASTKVSQSWYTSLRQVYKARIGTKWVCSGHETRSTGDTQGCVILATIRHCTLFEGVWVQWLGIVQCQAEGMQLYMCFACRWVMLLQICLMAHDCPSYSCLVSGYLFCNVMYAQTLVSALVSCALCLGPTWYYAKCECQSAACCYIMSCLLIKQPSKHSLYLMLSSLCTSTLLSTFRVWKFSRTFF